MTRKIFILTALVMMIFCVNACAFSDVQSGSWYYDNVTDMTNQGYLSGYEDGTFRPDGTVTKAEFVSIVGRLASRECKAKQSLGRRYGENGTYKRFVRLGRDTAYGTNI